ncbi:hypothetical protein Pyrfu_1156 [Pyrolobus fumarii 1A]|uniref:FHA domain-containing protein n=1 Tax=Pyrolobus fumarii (strain DSM 11204 / 1A) TaxID=694429 RepID=G0EFJ7_PYRF1|nr:zinc-ribbon domain-containing protein [Pyrolobus fumarii]AEM39021.1 hypothetical protein Pyrfu_1156 [Pyrolobus fumarii 1A]
MSSYHFNAAGRKRCPACGYANPPDAIYCQNCGARLDETRVMSATFAQYYQRGGDQQAPPPAYSSSQHTPQTVSMSRPTAVSSSETVVASLTPQPVQQHGVGRSTLPTTMELPIPYRLIFPDGRYIEVYEKSRVFGREDFEGLIPEPYIRYITRREKGGQFRIWCEIRDINTIICYIRDDYSTNPTFLNNQPIKGRGWIQLKDGDVISPAGVINIVFKFAAPLMPSSQQSQQP